MEMSMAGGVTPWNDGSQVSQTAQLQSNPSTAVVAANGNFITTWAEYDPILGRMVIKAKVLAFDGSIVKDTFVVSSALPPNGGGLTDPSVTVVNGNFIISYESGAASSGHIYTTVLNGLGNIVVGEQQVNTTTTGSPQDAKVVAITGGYMVVWEANGVITSQVYNSAGGKVGSEARVSLGTAAYTNSDPTVTTMDDGRSVVAWRYAENGVDPETGDTYVRDYGFRLRLVNSNGSFPSPAVQISISTGLTPPTDISVTAVHTRSGDRFLVSWVGADGTLLGRIYNSDGTLFENSFSISPTNDNGIESLGVGAALPGDGSFGDGSILFTWVDALNGQSFIRAKVLDANGSLTSVEFTIASAGGAVSDLNIVSHHDGRFTITWREGQALYSRTWDIRDPGSDGVFARDFDTGFGPATNNIYVGTVGKDRLSGGVVMTACQATRATILSSVVLAATLFPAVSETTICQEIARTTA
jgi:hypothetical protein